MYVCILMYTRVLTVWFDSSCRQALVRVRRCVHLAVHVRIHVHVHVHGHVDYGTPREPQRAAQCSTSAVI